MSVVVLDIPAVPPRINAVLGRHWSAKHRERKLWSRYVWAAKCSAYPGVKFVPPRRALVVVERHAKRLLDDDNAVTATLKFVLDSLKEHGLIYDDSPAHLERRVRQFVSRTPHTIISIEAIQ